MKSTQLIAAVVLMSAICVSAHAQTPGRSSSRGRASDRPAISPYYDLLNRGNNSSFGFQYFRRVRPEIEFRKAENQLRQGLKSLSTRVDQPRAQSEASMLGTTGHAASFNTQRKYFNVGGRSSRR